MDQLRTLLWLKWRLTVRAYERTPMRFAGLVLFVVVFGTMSVAIAGLCYAGFVGAEPLKLTEGQATQLLHMLLFGMWCFWLLAPALGFPLSEGYDITKQLGFPVPRMRMFVASILSSFIGVPIVFLLPLVVAVIVGFSRRTDVGQHVNLLAVPLAALALGILVLHMVSLGEALLVLLLGVLRSRRYQDIITVFLPFIGILIFLGFHLVFRATDRDNISFQAILAAEPSRYLTYTPSGLAANAIDAASYGEYGRCALAVALLAVVTVAVFWLGSHLMQRVYAGEIIDSRRIRPSREPGRRPAVAGPALRWLRLVPAPLLAVTLKELRYLWRDPQMKSALLGLAVPVLWLVIAVQWDMQGQFMPSLIGAMFIFAGALLAMNTFGYDREGLNILFLFPSDRRVLLIGKNVLSLAILIGASTLGLTAAAMWLRQPAAVPTTFPFLVAASFVCVAGGNVTSVYYPLRVVARGESPFSRSAEQGCLANIVRAVVFWVTMFASLPIAAGFLTPHYLDMPALYLLTAPVSIMYGAGVYAIVLPYAASALLQRETRLIEICTATDEP
ncbi:MAG: hypothetical protein PVH68_01285 [Armatimonadota bacterium]